MSKKLLEILNLLKEDFEMLQDGRWEIHLASDNKPLQASIDNIDKAIESSKKLESTLEWFNSFVDFVGNVDSNLYNQACEYADKTEE